MVLHKLVTTFGVETDSNVIEAEQAISDHVTSTSQRRRHCPRSCPTIVIANRPLLVREWEVINPVFDVIRSKVSVTIHYNISVSLQILLNIVYLVQGD